MSGDKQRNERSQLMTVLGLFFNIGFSIAIPLVGFALIGRYVDRMYQTSPIFLISGILLSLVVTSYMLIILFQRYLKEIEDQVKKEKK